MDKTIYHAFHVGKEYLERIQVLKGCAGLPVRTADPDLFLCDSRYKARERAEIGGQLNVPMSNQTTRLQLLYLYYEFSLYPFPDIYFRLQLQTTTSWT